MATLPTLTENTFTHSGDKHTFYWSAGPASGPLVIFIHGWPANGETWKPQLLALAALGFHTIAPDTRGYGRSSAPDPSPRSYALAEHVSDMRALLAHLERPRALWIGHDWGAGLVWGFAAQHPELVAGVCCLAVPYRCVENGGLAALVALSNRDIYPADRYPLAQWDYQAFHVEQPARSAAQLDADVANALKLFYAPGKPEAYGKPAFSAQMRRNGGWFGDRDSAPETALEASLFARYERGLFERMVAEFERNGFAGPNAYYLNHEVNLEYCKDVPNGGVLHFPVLFVEAKWDSICATSLSRLAEPMREYCRDLTEVSIEAGHWVALEKPEETNAAIVRWIATKLPHYFPGYWKTPFVSSSL
ncbi:alpha beta hydrolase [Diplodia corticola]|uniref:Alpha beta hydrolase n=1 Tax=Diplodia corticola TaxID=236234 RepID=A0A1J9RKT7_9PEZI|nr:alpha beta hydrolase [Diplodia corticola]OJD40578.1 alpha beta hydrolase [Diplodia corticola]